MILLLSTVCAYADEATTAASANEINIDAQYSGPYNSIDYMINDYNTAFLYSKNKPVTINLKSDKKIKQIIFDPYLYKQVNSIKATKNKIIITSISNTPEARGLQFRIEYEDDRYGANNLYITFLPDTYPQDNPNQTAYKYQGSPKIINITLTNTTKPKQEKPPINIDL